MTMKKENYPAMGAKVSFIRVTDEQKVLEGKGHIQAIFLDPNKRIMAQVREEAISNDVDAKVWNIDLKCVEPSTETKKAYVELVKEIKDITEKGNTEAQKVVASFNEEIEEKYSALLGEPVELE